MGSSDELGLECKVESYSMLLKYSFGGDHYSYDNLHDFVSRLEQERLKIDVFKRELPLCMQLLTNAVETSRRQLEACKTIIQAAAPPKAVVEELFMPLKNSTPAVEDEKPPTTVSDKANWMTSVQLWSQASDVTKQQSTVNDHKSPSKEEEEEDCNNNHNNNNSETCIKQRINYSKNSNGAFVPFNKDRNSGRGLSGGGCEKGVAEMELLEKSEKMNGNNDNGGVGVGVEVEQIRAENVAAEVGLAPTTSSNTNGTAQATHRKARRCWSPDLHRRFVNALQTLGGSQVATPKQIRELMKVDGLTNDEVKSHLQKYRLHTRRPGPTPQASGPPAAHLVLLGLGGLWVPPEYAAAQPSLYGTTAATSHFYTSPSLPQEFYTRTAPQPHLQHHHHHQFHHDQVQLYKGPAPPHTAESSPESEVRGSGERSEEEKSGSSSWRMEGGENLIGDERIKGRSEEREESNRSEITLKF